MMCDGPAPAPAPVPVPAPAPAPAPALKSLLFTDRMQAASKSQPSAKSFEAQKELQAQQAQQASLMPTSMMEQRMMKLYSENERYKAQLEEAQNDLRELHFSVDKVDAWEKERMQLLMEHARETDMVLFENRELKKLLDANGGGDTVRTIQEEFVTLHKEKQYVEQDLQKMQQECEQLSISLHGTRQEFATFRHDVEMREMDWKERERGYIQKLESVGVGSSLGSSHSRMPSPSRKEVTSLFSPAASTASGSKSLSNSRVVSYEEKRNERERAHLTPLMQQALDYKKEREMYRARASSPRHMNKLHATDPTTSIVIKVGGQDPTSPGSPTNFICQHVLSPSSPSAVDIRYNPASRPNPYMAAETSSFVPKYISKSELNEEIISKVRETTIFTSAENPWIFLGNQRAEKEDINHFSKEEMNKKTQSKKLGHFADFTSSAASKAKDIPKASIAKPKGTKNSFKFTGKNE